MTKEAVDREDLIQGFTAVGLSKGSSVIVHSSLSSFGVLKGGAEVFVEALQNILTPQGLIIMPAFSYGYEPFDMVKSPSRVSRISEFFRNLSDVVRSDHPTHSVCAWGKDASKAISGHRKESAFGPGTPLWRIQSSSQVLLVGVDYTSCSMGHVGQEKAKAAYLDRSRIVEILGKDGTVSCMKVRRAGCSVGFNALEKYIDEGFVKRVTIGNSSVSSVPSSSIVGAVVASLKEDQESLCCNRQSCLSCSVARAMIVDYDLTLRENSRL